MINLLRKNQRELMLVVATLPIVAFIFLYNSATLDDLAATRNPKIYGQTLTPGTLDRQVKNYQLTLALGQFDLISKLGGNNNDQATALSEFVWNLLVLRHQALLLGVEPTDAQVEDRIKAVTVFQTDGQFDPIKYAAFVRDQLAPRGFSERQIEEVMRDALRLEKVASIVESPISVGEGEIREAARSLQPVTAEFVRFNTEDVAKGLEVAPGELAAFFERNQANLNTQETRAVKYVAFELPKEAKLEGRAKVEALQNLADHATKFTDSLAGQPFEQAAGSAELKVRSTPAFDRSGSVQSSIQSEVDSAKQNQDLLAKLAPTAFLLTAVGNTSDIVQVGDAFYVMTLSELNPPRPLTLAEATPLIESRLRQLKAEQTLRASAEDKIKGLRTALASGKKFGEAAQEAGLKIESVNSLSLLNESLTPDQKAVISSTLGLREGELSKLETAHWGAAVVFLQSRGPLDDKEMTAKRDEIVQTLRENKRNILFSEWLRLCREDAKISVPGNPQS